MDPASRNRVVELENNELKNHIKYLNSKLAQRVEVNNDVEELNRLREENNELKKTCDKMRYKRVIVLNKYAEKIDKLTAENNDLKQRLFKTKKDVDIEKFEEMMNEVEDDARKNKTRQSPQFIADLQSMWSRIPDAKKTDKLKDLWKRKFSIWDDIRSSQKDIQKKRSENQHMNTCYELLDDVEANLERRRRRRTN